MRRSWTRPVLLFLVAMGGTAGGHATGYVLAHSHPTERAEVLAHSGHGYWGTAVALAIFGGLSALLAQAVIAFLRRRGRGRADIGVRATWLVLSLVQCGLFGGIETLERLLSGAHAHIWQEPAVMLGLPIQILFGALGALLLRGAAKVGSAIARRRSPFDIRATSRCHLPPRRCVPVRGFVRSSRVTRGPPRLRFS